MTSDSAGAAGLDNAAGPGGLRAQVEKKHFRIEYAPSLVWNAGHALLERRQHLCGGDIDTGGIDAH